MPASPRQQTSSLPATEPDADIERQVRAAIVAGLAAAGAASAGSSAAGTASVVVLPYAALEAALVAILAPKAGARFFLLRQIIDRQWNTNLSDDDEGLAEIRREILEQEVEYERIFARRSAERVRRALLRAAREGRDQREALRKALEKERRYGIMRDEAVRRRVTLRVEEEWVQSISPEGAYWMIDPSKRTHTLDCLAMAGKAWTWRVLAVIRPSNRHNLCGCRLLPLALARSNGLNGDRVVGSRVPAAARLPHR